MTVFRCCILLVFTFRKPTYNGPSQYLQVPWETGGKPKLGIGIESSNFIEHYVIKGHVPTRFDPPAYLVIIVIVAMFGPK